MTDEKQIISHLYQDIENGQWVIQTNDEHQKGVAELAAEFSGKFGLHTWGYVLGMLHDRGKERNAFQQYIRRVNGLPIEDCRHYQEHNHAFVGGILAIDLLGKNVLNLMANQIISHHTGLHDYVDAENILEGSLPVEVNSENIGIDTGLLLEELRNSPFSKHGVGMKHFHHLSRMLFSCLVDADRLDTERFMNVESWRKRGSASTLSDLLPKLESFLYKLQSGADDTDVNRIRREVSERCCKTSSGGRGFYSLTVPTGGGKTLSSLLWAMKHAVHHSMRRIIIAIPYTSIIVQTAGVLKSIFGEKNVLEHHSGFNPEEIIDEEVREKAILAAENWDYPIIVTTNVQLFESMFSNRPSVCRKLHNIVDSVIILDEVQTLPTDFLQPIVDAMKAYHKLFGVSFLFTTASQPVLSGTIEGTNPNAGIEGIEHVDEIIPEDYALHDRLRRVNLVIDNVGKTYDEMAAELTKHDKVLCIVNTRKDAKELYDRLPDEGVKMHLSRMMCPAHISRTISRIKALLENGSQPVVRVIATQLVEAGVDIDFPVVFRQEAGLDSVLQAAGRCNREGKHAMGQTFVFSLSAQNRIPFGSIAAANNARLNLSADSDWFAPSVMTEYFKQLYSRKNTFDEKNINHYLYKPEELCFEKASELFRLIDDDGMNLIVNWENSFELVEKLKEAGCSYSLMKQLAQFTVNIHRSDFNKLKESGAVDEIVEGVYVAPDKAQYDDATGLSLENHWAEEILTI